MDAGYNYGVRSIEVNADALDNQVLEITKFRGRTKFGTIVSIDEAVINRVDLNEKLETDEKFKNLIREENGVKVYLGVPQLKLSQPNVSTESSGKLRYMSIAKTVEDEVAGGNPQELENRLLNVRVLFESDDREGFETIPVFRLAQSRELDGKLKRDTNYYPPCIAVDAHLDLRRGVMEAAYDLLNSQGEILRRQVVDSGTTFATQLSGAVDRLMLLRTINEGLGMLNCLAFAEGVHPFQAYTAFCQLIGRLSVFGADKSNGEMPRYNHEDLHTIFQWSLDRIRSLISLEDEGYFAEYFKGIGHAKLQATLQPEWFSRSWQLVLGINSLDIPMQECLKMLSDGIEWKLANPSYVDTCYERRARGLKLRSLRNTPNVLPKTTGWGFFSIENDGLWDEIKTESAVGLRLNQKQVANLNELDNNSLISIKTKGKEFQIQFAMFAIKNTPKS